MNTKKFSHVMSEIDIKYVDEAICYQQKKKKTSWMKWTSIAACFALIVGIGLWQSGWIGTSYDIATLENGDQIIFAKSDTIFGSLSLDYDVITRALTKEETHTLFADLPVTANAVFNRADNQLVGFEGKIENMKMVITTSDLPLLDTVIVGSEKTSEVDGVLVTAGYFLTDPNSQGKQTAIYNATFVLGSSTIYIEHAGTKAESETVKNDLATMVQKLIVNGELDTRLDL